MEKVETTELSQITAKKSIARLFALSEPLGLSGPRNQWKGSLFWTIVRGGRANEMKGNSAAVVREIKQGSSK